MTATTSPLVEALKAAGEPTRLRILALLYQGELAVGEMVQILEQSQPRLSHHLKALAQSGLVQRLPEGAWVFYRLARHGRARRLLDAILDELDLQQAPYCDDIVALQNVRIERATAAESYFAGIAERWDRLRSLHYPEHDIERALLDAAGEGPFRRVVDLGTGTGRMMELFAARAGEIEGLDFSHQMLTLARANLADANITNAHVLHGRVEATPFRAESADLVILHQVLHYLDRPEAALSEAARIMRPGGHLLLIDFAPHGLEFLREKHGHRHLGVRDEDMSTWVKSAGLSTLETRSFQPPKSLDEGLEVKLWKLEKPRLTQEVAA